MMIYIPVNLPNVSYSFRVKVCSSTGSFVNVSSFTGSCSIGGSSSMIDSLASLLSPASISSVGSYSSIIGSVSGSFAGSSGSSLNIQSVVTPNVFASERSFATSGVASPVSHFDIACLETPMRSANAS